MGYNCSTFFKTNDAQLQHLENQLMNIKQEDMMISQYFIKIKSFRHEIAQQDPDSRISKARMRRIIIYGLRPDYHGYIIGVRDWQTQPTLLKLEGLSATQEILIK